ncbi:MAG: RluA family pseudouridine synthase [Gilvibacter sp.]
MIRGGETIAYYKFETNLIQKSFDLKLEVLFQDDFIAAINKPAGILVSGNSFKTIANALSQNIAMSSLADATDPQPVHRLDYATTGVLLVGKTSESIRSLNKLFENKQIQKMYYAITMGAMSLNGTINTPIDGKESCTQYEVLKTVESDRFKKLNLVKLTPKTGRRHQLRKHLASLGNPILGDRDYCPEALLLKKKGMYLHAASLAFIHPFTGAAITVDTGLPKRFVKLL